MNNIKIKETDLIKSGKKGVDEFLAVFTDAYEKAINNDFSKNFGLLNGHQHVLLSYKIFREEVCGGGFVQLIQNGYGGYIFDNPFAKSMREFGAHDFSKLVYKAKKIYDENKKELEKETTEDEFYSMYVDFEAFDEIEEEFFEIEELTTDIIAHYVDENLDFFAEILK